jgi:2'-5' RNA ligase
MRLFFAVNLVDEVKQGIQDAIDRFPVQNPPWRWVSGGNLHITLKFLGEMEESSIATLVGAAKQACAEMNRFTLSFASFGAFPSLQKPRVLFYRAAAGGAELERLAAALDQALNRAAGIGREKRPFRSHITIARLKTPLPGALLAQLESVPPLPGLSQEVSAICLIQSELRPSGAVYRLVKEIALA